MWNPQIQRANCINRKKSTCKWTSTVQTHVLQELSVVSDILGFHFLFLYSRKCVDCGLFGASQQCISFCISGEKIETSFPRIPWPLELVNKRYIHNIWKTEEKEKPFLSKGKITQIIGSSFPWLLEILLRISYLGVARSWDNGLYLSYNSRFKRRHCLLQTF